MRILVTGGAGFIGSHLADRLLAAGHQVRVLDNLSTGRIENLPNHPAFEFNRGDVRDEREVAAAVAGCDAVVHLAAVASVPMSVRDPMGTHRTNLGGTLNLLEAVRRSGIRRFLYASSAAIYGDRSVPPVGEEVPPNPLTPYAVDKLAGEYYLAFYGRQYGLAGTAFRFFNIYGPRQDPGSPYSGVISVFVERARSGRPVTLYGDGEQTRDFVYVADVAEILAQALTRDDLSGLVINIGRGEQCSLLDLLGELERDLGHPIERHYEAPRAGDIRRSCADPARLNGIVGWTPKTPLTDGLARLLASVEVTMPPPSKAPETRVGSSS